MARKRRQRFGRLLQRYKDSGGNPSGTELTNFKDFLEGRRKIDVNRKPAGELLQRYRIGAIPFGISPGNTVEPTDIFSTTITGQALAIYRAIGAANSVFGLQEDATPTFTLSNSYNAALAKIFVHPTGAALTNVANSGVTGNSYKRYLGRSGSIPFGRSISTRVTDAQTGAAESVVDDVDFEDVSRSLLSEIKGQTIAPNFYRSVTIEPEFWEKSGVLPTSNGVNPTLSFS